MLLRGIGPIISTFWSRLAFPNFLFNFFAASLNSSVDGNVLLPKEMYLKMDMFMCCSTKWLRALRPKIWNSLKRKTTHPTENCSLFYYTYIQIPVVQREITLILKLSKIVWNLREFIFHELEIIANKAENGCTRKKPDIQYIIRGWGWHLSRAKWSMQLSISIKNIQS